jgi:hypothetical protein
MIRNRFQTAGSDDMGTKENGLWPQDFGLVE